MDVASAVADPVRREILSLLRRHGPLPVRAITPHFAISRPAVSRHLRVLREAGLVVDQPRGRERVYRLEPGPLAELDDWLAQIRSGWPARLEAGLDALETEVRRTTRDRRAARRARSAPSTGPNDEQENTA